LPRKTPFRSQIVANTCSDAGEAGLHPGALFSITMHPQVIGGDHRLMMLEQLSNTMRSRDGVAFSTMGDYADRWRTDNPLDQWITWGAPQAQSACRRDDTSKHQFRTETMITVFRSTTHDPRERGREFGAHFAAKVQSNVATYSAMFARLSANRFDIAAAGQTALVATENFAPALHAEMLGIADGAGVEPALIGALNARTEILGAIRAGARGECSAVIHLPPELHAPVAVQTWDWFQIFHDSWLVWEIPLADGSMTKTMTEYGIVGKSGLNTRGLGLLFTILHHANDGAGIGVPVHVAARATLDGAQNIYRASQLLASAAVTASSSINLVAYENSIGKAMSVELHPGGPSFILPDAQGFVIHTNHFLAPEPARNDTEPKSFPDTLLRHDLLRRRLGCYARPTTEDVLDVMRSLSGGEGAVCCSPEPGCDPASAYATLSTVILDVQNGILKVLKGSPCDQ